MDSLPRVSILIPAYNEEVLLADTLQRVHACFAEISEPSYEVVVCDNNSTDRTAQVAQLHGARVVFEPHNQISRARNAAAGHARGEWFIFLDADTALHAELLRDTLHALGSGQVGGGGSVLQFDHEAVNPGTLFFVNLWNRISVLLKLAAGSYLFCLRPAWEAAGGFDEKVYAGEEIYFSRRVKKWCRQRRLRFQIFTRQPIKTSARKLQWFSQWQLLGHMIRLAVPGALKRQKDCGLWYVRPPSS